MAIRIVGVDLPQNKRGEIEMCIRDSTKTRKRIGRGTGSGLGGTSTRGHKGAKSRSGYSKKIGLDVYKRQMYVWVKVKVLRKDLWLL